MNNSRITNYINWLKQIYRNFSKYFDLKLDEIDNEYMLVTCIMINDQWIISTFDLQFCHCINYQDCQNMFINNIFHFYFINKQYLTDIDYQFIYQYYQYCSLAILKKFNDKFHNENISSYILLKSL